MTRAIAGALASAGGFIAGYVAPSLIFLVLRYLRGAPPTDEHVSALDYYAVMLYLSGVYALLGAVAYAAVTAASRSWRQRPLLQVAAISALAGVPAHVLHWTGLSMIAVQPFLHVLPQNLATFIGITMQGAVIGLAVLLWSATRKRGEPVA